MRESRKRLKRLKKARRKHERKRLLAAGKYGLDVTMGPCTRKKRYASRRAAEKQIKRSERYKGTPHLSTYKCRYCGGWHLTSHPLLPCTDADGGDCLTVLEVFEAAREAALRIRALEEEAEIRRERVGVQGHGYEVHAKSGILDPMRKVDDFIDWQQSQISMLELEAPIDEAWDVIRGIMTLGDTLAVELVVRHYLQAETWASIASGHGNEKPMYARVEFLASIPRDKHAESLRQAFRTVLPEWERIGIAKLKQLGREEDDD